MPKKIQHLTFLDPNNGPFLREAKEHLAAMLRGPWTTAQVAFVAELPTGTVRNYADRDPRRIDAWEWLKLDKNEPSPRPRFSTSELFQACTLAEVGRYGVAPDRAKYIVDVLTRNLFERVFGHETPRGREPAEWWSPGWLVAENRVHKIDPDSFGFGSKALREVEDAQRERGEVHPLSLQDVGPGCHWADLGAYFADPERHASATWIVIDKARLLRRILVRIGEAGGKP